MSLKDDISDVKNEVTDLKQNKSFAMEIMQDLKKENITLKIILAISIILNIILILTKIF